MPATTLASVSLDVLVPLPLQTKWVAFACRTAGVSRPKWHSAHGVWTATATADDGVLERVTIQATSERVANVRVAWEATCGGGSRQTHTARRITSGLVTSMQWAIRRRNADESGTFAVSTAVADDAARR